MYGDESYNNPNPNPEPSVNPPVPPAEHLPSEAYPAGNDAYTERVAREIGSGSSIATPPSGSLSVDAFEEDDTPASVVSPDQSAVIESRPAYTPPASFSTGQIPPYTPPAPHGYTSPNYTSQGYNPHTQGYPQGYAAASGQSYSQGYNPQSQNYGTQGQANPQSQSYGTQGQANPQSQNYGTQGQANPPTQSYGTQGQANSQSQSYGTQTAPRSYDPYAASSKPVGTPPSKKPKKNRTGLIVALFLVVTVLAGGFGIGAGFILSESLPDAPEVSDTPSPSPSESPSDDTSPSASDKPSGVGKDRPIIETTLPEGQMSIQDVYDVGILSSVAIFTEIEDRNAFNQTVTQSSAGSGFVITTDGYIITNYHVIQNAVAVRVVMHDGTPYSAEVIGGDELNDVAVIKIDATGLTAAAIGDSDELRVGDTVLAIGNPLGELQNTLTVGYLSAKERAINIDNITCIMMQTDLAISPGNSGGPLFNLSGQVVGITSAKTVSTDVEGISFSIPINHAVKMINEILEKGEVTGQAHFGIQCQDSATVVEEDLPEGVYIAVVDAGGPAEQAGLKEGDVITAVNGQKVKTVIELLAQKNKYKSGDTATLTIVRNGKEMEVSITFGDVPESTPETTPETETPSPGPGYGDDFPWDSFPDDFWDNW